MELTGRVSIQAYYKTLQQIACIFKAKIPALCFLSVQLLSVFVFAYRAANSNQHSDVA